MEIRNLNTYNSQLIKSVPQAELYPSKTVVSEPTIEPKVEEIELLGRKQLALVDLEETSNQLKGSEPFEMVGKDSKLESLDIDKAIYKMQKDNILQQYQFFVGDNL